MADRKEKDMEARTTFTSGDFFRILTSAGAAAKATLGNVAKWIIESYAGSSLAGSSRSVKAALDSLNSKTNVDITAGENVVIDVNISMRCGNMMCISVKGHALANINGAELFSLSGVSSALSNSVFVIGYGTEWNITRAGYGHLAAKKVSGRVSENEYFHVFITTIVA